MPGVTVYTVPNCSSCAEIKRFLTKRQAQANVHIAPVTMIDEQAFYGTIEVQRPLLEAALRALET